MKGQATNSQGNSGKPRAGKRNKGKKKVTVQREPTPRDLYGNIIRGYSRTLDLGGFADSGRAPTIRDVEIAVCFADLRGFTDYVHKLQKVGQDNRVQHFLRSYFRIYPEAVLRGLWSLEPDTDEEEISALTAEIRRLGVPTSYKNLGDGIMIVWELQSASDMVVQGNTTRHIYNIIDTILENFTNLTTNFGPVETDSFSRYATDLRLGFGLARGHAWQLDFGHHMPVDYAGSIVNLAARLQTLARPQGIVAQLGFSESLFRAMAKEDNGRICVIKSVRGLGDDPLEVWVSNDVQLPTEILYRPQLTQTSKSTGTHKTRRHTSQIRR